MFLWLSVFDREKKKLRVERRKKKKNSLIQLPGFGTALLHQLLASRAGNFTTQPRKQNTRYIWSLNIISRDHASHRLKNQHFSRDLKYK